MKVALLGDVHANLPALEAVLGDAHQHGVDQIWNIGDFLGYGAFPNEVVQRLRQEGAISIIGNYDLKVLRFHKKAKKWRKTKIPQKWMAFKWADEHLSKVNRKYLKSLPQELWLQVEGKYILLTHASPASNEEPLTPEMPLKRLQELTKIASKEVQRPDAIIFGHSHREFARLVDGVWFINTGSVGRPDDGNPRACYALLNIDPQGLEVEHFRLDYDVEKSVAAIHKHHLPEAFAQMLIEGRDLDSILDKAPSDKSEPE
jgi:putative phosphoesterase